jgi:hypothetical protein
MIYRLVYVACMQAAWFACVLGASHDRPLVGPLAVLLFAALLLAKVRSRWREAGLLVLTGVIGYLLDSGLVLAGVLGFAGRITVGWPSPVWMVALWVNLAVTLHTSMDWLSRRYALAALVGAICGPAAYLAGVRMGAAQLGGGRGSLLVIAALWAVAMPLLVWLADRTTAAGMAPRPTDDSAMPSPGAASP